MADALTERLYYEKPYQQTFDARVVDTATWQGRFAVILDRTCFYPTSGGQQHDTGVLGNVPVVDVQVTDAGEVLHIVERPLQVGEHVQGRIDWPRRYDHMQQHSGQHLISQAFHRLLGMETVSVHFGDVLCTVDLDAPELTADHLQAVEEHANAIVWENRPIRSYWVTEEEIGRIPLRRPPKVTGQIRIVEIEDYDWSACGGTHVRRTGELGPIALLRVERHRGRSRVHFLCGRRALLDYQRQRGLLSTAAGLLDTSAEETPALVEKLQARLKEQDRTLRDLQEQLLGYRAQELLATAPRLDGLRMVVQVLPDLDVNQVKTLAGLLTEEEERVVALLGCEQTGKGTVVFARTPDVDLHMGQLLRQVLGQFGGGGGGRPELAQGGGVAGAVLEELLKTALEQVRTQYHTESPR